MKSVVLEGEIFIGATTKTMRIDDLEGTRVIYSGSMFTFDTTCMNWYTQEFIEPYKTFNKLGAYIFPYLVRNKKCWWYE